MVGRETARIEHFISLHKSKNPLWHLKLVWPEERIVPIFDLATGKSAWNSESLYW